MTVDRGDGQRAEVECLEVLRELGARRRVYGALWEGRPVVVKVFASAAKAGFHARREWRGLTRLAQRRIRTPEPLFCGRTARGWAVVTERIADAASAGECWDRAATAEEKVHLLCRLAEELAVQHTRGVRQLDLHLGNFLVRGDEVFILDPAMMRFQRGPVNRRRSIAQVAQLAAMLSERTDLSAVETVFRRYADARAWSVQPGDLERLRRMHRRCRRSSLERGVRKSLRTNRRHQAFRRGPWRGLAERPFLALAGIDALTMGLDEAMGRGRILKDGRTSFVSHANVGGVEVVVKRYNHKGLLHSLRHTLKGSRAKRCWMNANRLALLRIPTAKPLAYIDQYKGPLLHRSYFITAFVNGRNLHGVLTDGNVPGDRKRRLIDQVMHTIDRLAGHGISHGDMKHTNILYDGTDVVLTDLDAMRISRTASLRRRRCQRDRDRCLRDLAGLRMPS